MIDFQLFRIKVFPSTQFLMDQTNLERKPSVLLRRALKDLPFTTLQKKTIWHIGNLETVSEDSYYFRIGKTRKSSIEIYQEGNFRDEEFSTSPYTHVLLDTSLELCAIAKKPKLAANVSGIARQLLRLLMEVQYVKDYDVRFEINPIMDPENFVNILRRAYSIRKFLVTFSKPNPFDANEDFVKPMQRFLAATEGTKGKAEINGESLDVTNLEDVSRSAAATGDDAIAWILLDQNGKPIRKSIKGNPVVVKHDDVSDKDKRQNLLDIMRFFYNKVRGLQKGNNNE